MHYPGNEREGLSEGELAEKEGSKKWMDIANGIKCRMN